MRSAGGASPRILPRNAFLDGPERFARKVVKKPRPATTREAVKLIEALKGLKRSEERKAAHG
jgi:hypothetical protein